MVSVMFEVVLSSLLTPALLFFVLGIFAGFIKSDLVFPNGAAKFLAFYLLVAIGFSGGVAASATELPDTTMTLTVLAAIAIGFLLPHIAYYLLKSSGKLDMPTSAGIAAQYGSVSMVTFVLATTFLKNEYVDYQGYMVAVMALMHVPGMLAGFNIALNNRRSVEAKEHAYRNIYGNGVVVLLLGSFAVGVISGGDGLVQLEGFLELPFQGLLSLFMLSIGLIVPKCLRQLRNLPKKVVMFGIYMPLIGGSLGLAVASFIGLDVGSAMLMAVLASSASFIAVPLAMDKALPDVQESATMPLALLVSFPFNVIVGIPLYYSMANHFLYQ